MLLDACITLDGTEDLEFEGAARIQLARYLSDTPPISCLEGACAQDRYKPLIYKGAIAVAATDWQGYITRMTMQSQSVRSVASMLAALGARAVRVRGNGFKEQGRWVLPLNEFDPKDYQQFDSEEDGDGE